MKQAPILSAYREAGYIDTFPLHDDEEVDRLYKRWNKGSVLDPPIQVSRELRGALGPSPKPETRSPKAILTGPNQPETRALARKSGYTNKMSIKS